MFDIDFLQQKAQEKNLTKTETETFLAILNNIGKADEDIAKQIYCKVSTLQSRMTNIHVKFGTSLKKGPGKKLELIGILDQEYEKWKQDHPIVSNDSQDKYDFNSAPDISIFYGCTEELAKLRKWIIEDNNRLIVLQGITGIGKTYLARYFAKIIKNEFQCVFWYSFLSYSPQTPKEYLIKLLKKFHQWFSSEQIDISKASFDELLDSLIYYLTTYRCLLILDDFQYVLKEGKTVGTYQETYQGYGDLLLRIGQTSNLKSSLLLNSWDKPQGLDRLETKTFKTLHFKGSEETCQQILSQYPFSDSYSCKKLIEKYEKNPLLLKGIADRILKHHKASIKDFLQINTFINTNDYYIKQVEQIKRLSSFELKIIRCFPDNNQSISLEELQQRPELANTSTSKLITALDDSLISGRSLIEKQHQKGYSISPFILRIVKELFS